MPDKNHLEQPLTYEDTEDPACPFRTERFTGAPVRTVPVPRILQKLDDCFSRSDTAGAERLLTYWMAEAEEGRDTRGQLLLANELMGFYRKAGNAEKAFSYAAHALSLLYECGIENSIGAATSYINVATVKKAFGHAADAMPYFEKAQSIYEAELPPGDERLGGLYNNMGLALCDLGRYEEAVAAYEKALAVMSADSGNAAFCAVTYLNMAECAERRMGLENAQEPVAVYLQKAKGLLDDPAITRDGGYAYICEKCAPTFDYYGYFAYAAELTERARRIYERA